MNKKIFDLKTTIPAIRDSSSRSLSLGGFLLVALVLACFALAPVAQAVSPFPDGGYPGGNTAEGDFALQNLTTGNQNTAIGASALAFTTTGSNNTATGAFALNSNTAGHDNTALGFEALQSNTGSPFGGGDLLGSFNTAVGSQALTSNTTGFGNTANGDNALLNNTTGDENTASGYQALYSNTTGSANTASGANALFNNTGGFFNTANGLNALLNNTTGGSNTADGLQALHNNTTGDFNTADGLNALASNTSGSSNIGLGVGAGDNLTTGSNNIDIGNEGVAAEANTIRIGTHGTQKATFIAGIIGVPIAGATVHISGTGQLGIGPPSSVRFKDDIKPMDRASEAILTLKPVTFHYKKELDPEGIPQFGLVAEDVEKVNPALVSRDDQGKIYTVRYEAVNAMLLNEFLKEHRTVQELKSNATTQEAIIAHLKSAIAQQQKEFDSKIGHQQNEIEALTAGLQRVNAQLEANKPSPQIVVSDQ